jgi:hypothetical protein
VSYFIYKTTIYHWFLNLHLGKETYRFKCLIYDKTALLLQILSKYKCFLNTNKRKIFDVIFLSLCSSSNCVVESIGIHFYIPG